jgi:hypothetical protein
VIHQNPDARHGRVHARPGVCRHVAVRLLDLGVRFPAGKVIGIDGVWSVQKCGVGHMGFPTTVYQQ